VSPPEIGCSPVFYASPPALSCSNCTELVCSASPRRRSVLAGHRPPSHRWPQTRQRERTATGLAPPASAPTANGSAPCIGRRSRPAFGRRLGPLTDGTTGNGPCQEIGCNPAVSGPASFAPHAGAASAIALNVSATLAATASQSLAPNSGVAPVGSPITPVLVHREKSNSESLQSLGRGMTCLL